jgi:hypothetical protein
MFLLFMPIQYCHQVLANEHPKTNRTTPLIIYCFSFVVFCSSILLWCCYKFSSQTTPLLCCFWSLCFVLQAFGKKKKKLLVIVVIHHHGVAISEHKKNTYLSPLWFFSLYIMFFSLFMIIQIVMVVLWRFRKWNF